ncbi:MAG TPA: hypothetical protein VN808_12230 [Stellaceae bacterium]|nr:hypothetical protein [Stellaceae bacterium]
MMDRPLLGMAFGAGAIGLALLSMATRSETPPPGYWILEYGLLIAGVLGIIGSLVAHRRKR